MIDPLFADPPAPEDVASIELTVEVHQPLLEPLEHAADLLELFEVPIDVARHAHDLGVQRELLGRLAPIGPRLGRDVLVAVDEIAPPGIQRP